MVFSVLILGSFAWIVGKVFGCLACARSMACVPLVGLPVALCVWSGFGGHLRFGCCLLLLSGGKAFAIYLVVLYRVDAPFL